MKKTFIIVEAEATAAGSILGARQPTPQASRRRPAPWTSSNSDRRPYGIAHVAAQPLEAHSTLLAAQVKEKDGGAGGGLGAGGGGGRLQVGPLQPL